ncbi:MAG: nuclear transport factor 2 family protein [Limisphaerales bacterium]
MKNIFRLVLLAVVIAAGIWLWTVLFPGPEKVIRKRLATIARDACSNPNQNPLVSVANAQKLASYFSTNVEAQIEVAGHGEYTLTGRDEIMQTAAGAYSALNGIKVEFLDVTVTVGADKQSASAALTLKVQAAGDKEFIWQEMKFALQKIDGEWLITRLETVRTLT